MHHFQLDGQIAAFIHTLAAVPTAELERCLALFRPQQLASGAFWLQAGDVPHEIGLLTSGVLRLLYTTPDGHEVTKAFCCAPEFVAAYSALLLGQPSRLAIQALQPCTLLVAPFAAYRALEAQHPCWISLNRAIAERLFIKKEQRESELLLDDATTRYLRFLQQYPALESQVKQYHIAAYLGISPVTLSRIRAKLASD